MNDTDAGQSSGRAARLRAAMAGGVLDPLPVVVVAMTIALLLRAILGGAGAPAWTG